MKRSPNHKHYISRDKPHIYYDDFLGGCMRISKMPTMVYSPYYLRYMHGQLSKYQPAK